MLIKINVTENDILWGESYSNTCPIVRACWRIFNRDVYVTDGYIGFNHNTIKRSGVKLSKIMEKWADNFDDGKTVKPYTFHLKVPDHWKKYLLKY
jgi:hypothetical protein